MDGLPGKAGGAVMMNVVCRELTGEKPGRDMGGFVLHTCKLGLKADLMMEEGICEGSQDVWMAGDSGIST